MAVDLLLLLGEGRRREPRRLAAEVPIALLLLEEGRRHEPRGLAAVPLVLLLLGEGRRHAPCELAAEVRRLFCWCWERDDDAAPGGALLHGEVRRHLAGVWYDLGSVVTGPSDPREIAAYEAGRGGVLFLVL